MAVSSPKIGTRILLLGHIGTVKFCGSVHGTTGAWLGVEWDDPQRGKHDGAKDGVQYFTCTWVGCGPVVDLSHFSRSRRVPGAGSFVRQTPSIKYGTTFRRALLSKYVEDLHGSQGHEFVILGSSNGAIEVEAVNLDKVRNKLSRVEKLREVSLDGENVAFADSSDEIGKTCPSACF